MNNQRIIIIGGGLSGLTLAYLLSKRNINTTILEASSRLGGRIQTVKGVLGTPLELGATWFSDTHPRLISLIDELGLKKYPQFSNGISLFQTKSFEPPQKFFIPQAENPSYRLVGGTQLLIEALAQKLNPENVMLNTRVIFVKDEKNEILIETSNGSVIKADKVLICLPPQLVSSKIQFSPNLPNSLTQILPTVQTWMSGSLKFVLEYDEPFWRKDGYSGMLYSHSGIIMEMYDHTNFEENKFGFTGFLNTSASGYSKEVRKELVLSQLSGLLGIKALTCVSYFDKIWKDEFVLAGNQIIQRPHQNNGHPLLQQTYLNGKLFFLGTETSTEFAGYMEGAVISAMRVMDKF